jgi:hypothetical protein
MLYIKKKWRKLVGLMAAEVEEEADKADDAMGEDPDKARLNVPARNKATIPIRVPNNISYTRQALFDLLKLIEYSIDYKVYKTAWQRL